MKTNEKLALLGDAEAYEQVFRGGGVIEAEVERGEGEDIVRRRESIEFSVKEFLGTRDAIWMFPRVVSNVMLEAAEPLLLVTPLLNTVRINTGVRTVDYHAVGALQAHEVPEGMEYPEEHITWAQGSKTAKVTKKGLRIPITDEMIADSLFDLVSMYLRAAGRAMARFKEQLALGKFLEAAITVKNNSNDVAWAGKRMKGIGADGAPNGTLDAEDLLEVFGKMLASGRTPTDVIMHPLAWTMWAQDPLLRNMTWYAGGPGVNGKGTTFAANAPVAGAGGTAANASMAAFLQRTAPMGLNVITTPYLPFDATDSTTDILIIDRADIGALTVREDLSTENFDDPSRDIISMKVKERYDITIFPNEGYNLTKLANVKVARNYGREVTFNNDLGGQGFADYAGFAV